MIDLRISGMIGGAAFFLSLLLGMFSGAHFPMLVLRPILFGLLFFAISALVKYLISHFLPDLLEGAARGDDSGILPGMRIDITEAGLPGEALAFAHEGMGANMSRPSNRINAAVPKPVAVGFSDSEENIGNIADLKKKPQARNVPPSDDMPLEVLQAGMDQNTEIGYTDTEGMGDLPSWGGKGELKAPIKVPFVVDSTPAVAEKMSEAVRETPQFQPAPEPLRFASISGENGGSGGGSDMLPDLDSMAGAFRSSSNDDEREEPKEQGSLEYYTPASPKKTSSMRPQPQLRGDFNAKDLARGLQTVLSKENNG